MKVAIIHMKSFALLYISLLIITPCSALAQETNQALELIHGLGCKSCHTIKGEGGTLAPDLTDIGSRMTVAQISHRLRVQSSSEDSKFMPSYAILPEDDIQFISQYLYNLR